MFLQIVYKSEKLEMTEYGGQEMVWWEEKKKKKKSSCSANETRVQTLSRKLSEPAVLTH